MSNNDLNRLARNEQKIMEGQTVNFIRDIPAFPYSSLDELRTAAQSGEITLTMAEGFYYQPDLFWAFGTRAEILMYCFWITLFGVICIAYIIAAILTGKFMFLWGLLTSFIGLLLSGRTVTRLASPFIGMSGILLIFFILTNHSWAWVVVGFDAGYLFNGTAKTHASIALVNRALHSEVLFCHMYFTRVIVLKSEDAKTL